MSTVKLDNLPFVPADESITINTSTWTFKDICQKKYVPENLRELLNDLRGVYGWVLDQHYLKLKDCDGKDYILITNDEKLKKKLQGYKPFHWSQINLFQIVMRYSTSFAYASAGLSKENEPGHINLFLGYAFPEIPTEDFSMLDPLLKHVKEVICHGDQEMYDYLIKWCASIVQNVTVKLGTMPIIWGAQGSGKSIFVELVCALLGRQALANCDDLDKVFGKFNGLISQYLLICLNEPPEAGEKFKYNGKIKSKLTQKKTVQETKGVDSVEIESWANYIMTTNNANPVFHEVGNRRIIYFETDNKYCGNEAYFRTLMGPIQPVPQGPYVPEYMGVLLHYLKKVDIEGFNPERLIRQIASRTDVAVNEHLDREWQDMSALHRYVVQHYKDFTDEHGITSAEIQGQNLAWNETFIGRGLSTICTKRRVTINRVKQTRYFLKPREQVPHIWRQIDYQHHNSDTSE